MLLHMTHSQFHYLYNIKRIKDPLSIPRYSKTKDLLNLLLIISRFTRNAVYYHTAIEKDVATTSQPLPQHKE
jgi:hypothetical protein